MTILTLVQEQIESITLRAQVTDILTSIAEKGYYYGSVSDVSALNKHLDDLWEIDYILGIDDCARWFFKPKPDSLLTLRVSLSGDIHTNCTKAELAVNVPTWAFRAIDHRLVVNHLGQFYTLQYSVDNDMVLIPLDQHDVYATRYVKSLTTSLVPVPKRADGEHRPS